MASIAGEAAVRIVPSLRGFHSKARAELEKQRIEFDVYGKAHLGAAEAKIDAFRKAQEARDIEVKVRTDWSQLKRDLSQVEHIFKRNSFSRALRLNIVIAGLDLLPLLSYGAAGAAASLDTLAKAAFAIPGALGGALTSIGTLGVAMHGVKDAFKAFEQDQKQLATQSRIIADDNRQLANSYRQYGQAVRDTVREIQDLNAENRRSSLNIADAVLGVQEAADRLREGGQKTILELRRDQLSYLQSLDHLQEVATKAQRVNEDLQQANKSGVSGAERVVDALDQINKNIEKLNTDKIDKVGTALSKTSPNFQAFATATRGLKDEWHQLANAVQDNLFAGLDKTVVDLANNTFPMLERGMGRVATSYNGLIKSFAKEVGSKNSTSLIERIFGNTDVGVQRLSVGMRPFIDGILKLTKESSDFLPRLGDAGSKVAQRFDTWVYKISSDGRLDKWISKSLDGFTSLGNTFVNLGSSLSSLSNAFDSSTKNQGGFLKVLETRTKKLADYLKSPKGQNTLKDYFRETKEFIDKLKEAFVNIKPLIKDVVEIARDWSVFLFRGIAGFASLTQAIEKHATVLRPILMTYFAVRTVKPIWELLSNSFKAYEKLVLSAANSSAFGDMPGLQRTADRLKKFRGEAIETAKTVAAATANAATAAYTPGTAVNAQKVQAQAINRRIGSFADPLMVLQTTNGISKTAPVAKATYAPSEMFGPIAPAPVFPPNNRLSRRQRAEKAAALAAFREKSSKFYDFDAKASLAGSTYAAPALGAMQGPQLPPEIYAEIDNQAKKANKSVGALGDTAKGTAASVDDLDKKSSSAASSVGSAGDKSKKSKTEVEDLGKKSKAASKEADALHNSATKASTGASSVGSAAKEASPKVDALKQSVKDAGDEVGAVGGKVGLVGRLAGLAGALGPALGLTALMAGVSWAVSKMGEAHRDAAAAAKEQADQLQALADTLDSVTGGITRRTIADMATRAGKFTDQSGLFPETNLLESIARLGFDPTQLFTNAADPSKGAAYQQDTVALDNLVRQNIESSDVYKNNKAKFDAYNLDPLTLAKALRGDPAALDAVDNAMNNPKQTVNERGAAEAIRIPDLGALGNSLPNKDAFLLGRFLQDTRNSMSASGNALAQASTALGRARLTDSGSAEFGKYGVDPMMVIDPATGNGVLQLNNPPSPDQVQAWSEKGISVQENGPGNLIRVTIDPEFASTYLQRYASGGLVRGPGGPRDDKILASVSAGEHITNADAVSYYGADVFHALNKMALPKFAPGGWPFPLAPKPSPDPGGGAGSPVAPLPLPTPATNTPAAPTPATPTPTPATPTPATPTPSSSAVRKPDWTYGADGKPLSAPGSVSKSEFFGDVVDWYKANGQPVPPAYAEYDRNGTSVPATSPAVAAPGMTPADAPSPFTAAAATTPQPMMTPFLPGTPLPPSRTGGEGGLQVNTIGLKRTIETLFPAIQSIGGYREDPMPDHPSGAAIDVMIPGWDTPAGKAYGDQIAAWLRANGASMGVKSFIWQDIWNPITEPGEAHALKRMNQGPDQAHLTHLHILTNGGGFPTGSEKYRMPNVGGMPGMSPQIMQLLSGVFPGGLPGLLQMGPNGLYAGGVSPGMLTGDGIEQPMSPLDKMIKNWQDDPNLPDFLKPQQLFGFLGTQAGGIASSLLGIGTSFLSGITGIDFNWIVGLGQQIGNAASQGVQGWMSPLTNKNSSQSPSQGLLSSVSPGLGGLASLLGGGGGGGVSGASPGTDAAGSIISGIVNGQLDLSSPEAALKAAEDNGFNPRLLGGTDSTSASMTPDVIKAAVDMFGPSLGISKNADAWVKALTAAAENGSSLFNPEGDPNLGTPVQKAGAALNKAVRKWGINPSGGPANISYSAGGNPLAGLALLSNGEFKTNARATAHYGPSLFNALNSKSIPRDAIRRMADGGFLSPIKIPDPILNPPGTAGGQVAGPLPTPPPMPEPNPVPSAPDPVAAQNLPSGLQPPGSVGATPSTGGEPGPGATAPAPDPGSLPQVADALAGIGGAIGASGGGGIAQPGATGSAATDDPRGVLGAAPASQEHNLPALASGIRGAAATVGGLLSQAAQMAAMGASMGATGGMPIPGASQAGAIGGQFAQAGAQIAGEVAVGAVNIISSLLVGTATNGSTSSATGVPLLPQRNPMQTGVPAVGQQYSDNRTYNLTNLDEYRRLQERDLAQQTSPFIGKF